jgi:predicted RNase H-like nuclease (RuvC/YqgF family)
MIFLWKKINEFTELLDNLENKYFTEDEADNLIKKIDELQQSMISNINDLSKKSEEKENLINELKSEINALKRKIDIFDKKGMFKSLVAKMFQWAAKPENQKLIGDGVTIARNLIENK